MGEGWAVPWGAIEGCPLPLLGLHLLVAPARGCEFESRV